MHIKNKTADDTTMADLRFMEKAPKTVIFAIAKHFAARLSEEGYEGTLESGAYIERMRSEWEALHKNGIVPQKPPAAIKMGS